MVTRVLPFAAMKSFATSITINAPAERVWAILSDGARWTEWNTTVEKFEGRIAPGETVKLHVKANPGRAFPVKVSAMSAPSSMTWTGGMPLGLFKGERVFTITPAGSGVTFAMREQFTGPLSPLIGRSIPDLQPAFEEFGACLKKTAESTTGGAS